MTDLKQRILAAALSGLSFTDQGISEQTSAPIIECGLAIRELHKTGQIERIKDNLFGCPKVIAEINGEFSKANQIWHQTGKPAKATPIYRA